MSELSTIVEELSDSNANTVLATLVSVDGSSYRKLGARMLIHENGRTWGMLSGGCLEHEIREHCLVWTSRGPVYNEFAIGSAQETMFGWGSGCNATLGVLLERAHPRKAFLTSVLEILSHRTACGVATVYCVKGKPGVSVGDQILALPNEPRAQHVTPIHKIIAEDMQTMLASRGTRSFAYKVENGEARVLIEALRPAVSLLIFGAGIDSIPLVQFAKQLGWQVSVFDKHLEAHQRIRLRDADRVCEIFPEDIPIGLIDEDSAAVVMTHHYRDDLEIVERLLTSPLQYIGILAERWRANCLVDHVGWNAIEGTVEKLITPVGLNLGAATPAETAIAIIAEITTFIHGRNGGPPGVRTRENAKAGQIMLCEMETASQVVPQ